MSLSNLTTGEGIPQRAALSEVKRKLLEKYARGQYSQTFEVVPAITRRAPGELAPLSLFQEQIWLQAMDGNTVASFYNESTTVHRCGDLDKVALEHSFSEIIRRHETWRTTFDTIDGRPMQVIHPVPSSQAIPFIDLRTIPETSRRAEALRLATEDARRPFDLKHGPLVRPLLITLDRQLHLLFLTMHQSITDGVSVYQIFPSELTALYAALSGDEPPILPDLPIQYGDFALWERLMLQNDLLADEMAYWRKQLAGDVPQLNWPCACPPASREDYRGAIQAFDMPKQLCDGLIDLSRREGVTFFMTLLAGFTGLLFCYTRQQDITTGTVAPAGRKRGEVRNLLGYFLNPVALRVDLSGNPSVRDLLRRCREVTLGALAHDDVPLEYLKKQLMPELPSTRLWPFDMAITLAPPSTALIPGWKHTTMDCNTDWAKWALYLELSIGDGGIIGRAQYRTNLFTPNIISRLLQDLEALLQGFTFDCEQRISDLPRYCSSSS